MLILYSSGCTRCGMIENILRNKNIEYQIESNPNVYLKIAKENNIKVMPFAEINGKIYDSIELQNWLNEDK